MATIALSSRYGSKLAYDTGIWGESNRFFATKFLLVGVLAPDVRRAGFVVDLGMAFVDD